MTDSTQTQWMREATLIVGSAKTAIDLSQMHFRFHVQRGDKNGIPNKADIRIWNLSDSTSKDIQKEFTRVVLQAGYPGNAAVIFDGTIKQVRRGRDNATDTYLEIQAADNDRAYNFAVVKANLAAGSTPAHHVSKIVEAMNPYGVDIGYLPPLPDLRLPRGKVMFGMARDYMRDVCRSSDTTWSVDQGKLQMLPLTGYLPGEATVLTSNTGMIGLPEQTEDGIKVRCLLNPGIKIGSKVWINNRSIQGFKATLSLTDPLFSADTYPAYVPSIQNDGYYRVLVVSHSGDTRGQEWYSDLICLGLEEGIPQPLVNKGYLGETQYVPVKPYG